MGDSAVQVAVRTRPLSKKESAISTDVLQFCAQNPASIVINDKNFTFDYVFKPDLSNENLYNTVISDRLQYIFEGFNLTILAYGQTGSGKTFTMGTNYCADDGDFTSDVGIIPRGIIDIFTGIEKRIGKSEFEVKVSFLEVYREEVFDLLRNSKEEVKSCPIREDIDGIKVLNLTEVPVKSAKEALQALEQGSISRRVGSTAINIKSSRSHAIFSVMVKQKDLEKLNCVSSKFQLVDLAGSERAGKSLAEGIRLQEGITINKGLLALGNVISALCDEKQHIPYRDSKLTRLLMDSLGGNSHTFMIACISPSSLNVDESVNTLRYADRARKIKNTPVVNKDSTVVQLEKLKELVQDLQDQVNAYQAGSNAKYPGLPDDYLGLKLEIKNLHKLNELNAAKVSNMETKLEKIKEKVKLVQDKIAYSIEKLPAEAEGQNLYLEELRALQAASWEIMECADSSVFALKQLEEPLDGTKSVMLSELEKKNGSEESFEVDPAIQSKEEWMLQDIERELCNKELMAMQMEQRYDTLTTPEDVEMIENKMNNLENEKHKLTEALEKSDEKFQKEIHQERIKELEKEIHNLKAAVRKSKFVQELKVKNQQKIDQLQREIQELKRMKVAIMQKMKEENKQFRLLRLAKDKEVAQLKQLGRKKDIQYVKMEGNLQRKLNVLQQKYQKAAADQKRYNEALKLSNNVSAKSAQNRSRDLEQYLDQEIRACVLKNLSEAYYQVIEKEAIAIREQIKKLNEEGSPAKNNTLQNLKVQLEAYEDKMVELKDGSSHSIDGKTHIDRWNGISSVAHAKTGLQYLFSKCVTALVDAEKHTALREETQNKELCESKAMIKALRDENLSLKRKLEAMQNEYEEKLLKLKVESDREALLILNEMGYLSASPVASVTDLSLKENFKIQQREIAKLSQLQDVLDEKCKEVDHLKQQLFLAKRGKKTNWLGEMKKSSGSGEINNKSSSRVKEYLENNTSTSMVEEYLDDSIQSETDENDPDWRLTPVHKIRKRIKLAVPEEKQTSEISVDSLTNNSRKRSFYGCGCPGDCKTMRCGCRKRRLLCYDNCDCNKENCVNSSPT